MIELRHLSIGYRHKGITHAVATDISATLNSGQLTCLLGTNGAGKSTLLRTLAGFQPQLCGHILIGGRELSSFGRVQLALTVSVVLTERSNLPHSTVAEVVAMGRSPHTGFWGRLGPADRQMVSHAIALAGIGALAQRRISTLSDGERQKVMIAKALAQDTPIILLDEPTAFLDYPSKVDTMRLLHQLSRQTGKTILLSTHDMELALQAADQLWLLSPSAPLAIGAPEDLAISGTLSAMSQREGVSFNPLTGQLGIDFECHDTVGLTGQGPQTDLLRRALRRNGFDSSTHGQHTMAVRATTSGYELTRHGNTIAHTPTIGLLIEALRKAITS